jgi:hypothetical protein
MGSPHEARLDRAARRALGRLRIRRAIWQAAHGDRAVFRDLMQDQLGDWRAYSGGHLVATASLPEAALVKALDAGYSSVLLRRNPSP